MPDWFYRTVAQPLLFRLPDKLARRLALGAIGSLGSNALGRSLIDFLGHMRADPRLARTVAGVNFPSPIGIGWRVDPERRATRGLSRFGVGCIELLGHDGGEACRGEGRCLRGHVGGAIAPAVEISCDAPVLLRQRVDGIERVLLPSGQSLRVVPWDDAPGAHEASSLDGVALQWGHREADGDWSLSAHGGEALAKQVARWRGWLPEGRALLVAGGVDGPDDALSLLEAGADLALVDAGLVFSGPGLVKRCNEAVLSRIGPVGEQAVVENVFRRSWVWAFALGAALAAGGLATLFLALTRVLLPYDEHYLGLSAASLIEALPRVFSFMAHDRATLAGTMMGLGALYMGLAWSGIRLGAHGAKTAVVASALAGFATFFSFFGFGYFDTLHAFVAVVLFQLTAQIMVGSEGGESAGPALIEREDAAWRRSQWGQLFWVTHAVGLLGSGLVILGIGMSSVFVSEDLEFLCMSSAEALSLGDRMIAVIAHDRATLGGMLLASGVAMLLPTLWLYRRGAAWLWRAVFALGVPAYAAALGIHFWVGYTDWLHLAPAFAGLGLWALGLAMSGRYLLEPRAESAKTAVARPLGAGLAGDKAGAE